MFLFDSAVHWDFGLWDVFVDGESWGFCWFGLGTFVDAFVGFC
jgi:hypothetical protein